MFLSAWLRCRNREHWRGGPLARFEVANRSNFGCTWMEVMAPSQFSRVSRKLSRASSRADSIALDPHKWLYLPVDVGCIILPRTRNRTGPFSMRPNTRALSGRRSMRPRILGLRPELSRVFGATSVDVIEGSPRFPGEHLCCGVISSRWSVPATTSRCRAVGCQSFASPCAIASQKRIATGNRRLMRTANRLTTRWRSYLSNTTLGGRSHCAVRC